MTDAYPSTVQHRPVDDEISLWEVLAVLLRRRGTIVLTTVLVSALAVAVTFLRAETYTTAAAFRPQGSEASASQLLALASQFGVNVPTGGEEASPAFYAELLTSREILSRAAARPYDVEGEGTVLLKDLLEIEEDTEPLRDDQTIEWLRDEAVSVSTGRETGTVTLRITTEWPDLSQAIANELLTEVARFNLNTRQSQAASERTFIESRVREAEKELDAAEDSLRLFLEANRQWQNSPLLVFRQEGLQREVTLRQSVLTTLVQSYEQARISEVRDTPVITVLQTPFLPPGPDDRRLLLSAVLGIVLGGMSGIVLAFVVEAFRRPHAGDPARQDFQETWAGLKRSIPFVGG
ncbi:MAG: Wzz/FepE/Etk N-terminal domain-containing protein [Gemmatimonadota bacterium]|nr:Wzz/FepE/Etk N-terminal domain-containing protein [Gemmatimonadota bacterium]